MEKLATTSSNETVNDPILSRCCFRVIDSLDGKTNHCITSCKFPLHLQSYIAYREIDLQMSFQKYIEEHIQFMYSIFYHFRWCFLSFSLNLIPTGPLFNRFGLSDGVSGTILLVASLVLLCTCLVLVVKLLNSMLQ